MSPNLHLLYYYKTKAPTNPRKPITAHTPPTSIPPPTLPAAAPVNGATGAAFVACTLFVDSVRLGSELHVAPCATDTVVIVTAGRTGVVVDEDFQVTGEVEAALALMGLAGGQLETLAPSADFTVVEDDDDLPDEDGDGAAKAVDGNESDERGIELGRE